MAATTERGRSACAINLTLEVVGDKWSLLIIRDIIFGNRRHYRELLTKSDERISSNILADRLKTLMEAGILTRVDDPTHKQKGIYSLTEQGIELLPLLAQMAAWGVKYLPVSEELGIRAQLLRDGGPKMWAELHARPAAYTGDAVAELAWLEAFARRIGCGECQKHWRELVEKMPPDLTSAGAYRRWGVDRHDDVNSRLRKPKWVNVTS